MSDLNLKRNEIQCALSKSIESSNSKAKELRLTAFNKICEELVNNSVPLKISLVVKYMIESGHKMSQQSIYNKQAGENAYRNLFDLWSEYDSIKRASSKPNVRTTHPECDYIDDNDLKLIENSALRYRVSLMIGELKGLKKQNDMLKQIREMAVIHGIPEYMIETKNVSEVILSAYEIDIIKEFVSGGSHVVFSEDGVLTANLPIRKGQILSSPGIKNALLKVLDSYNFNTRR